MATARTCDGLQQGYEIFMHKNEVSSGDDTDNLKGRRRPRIS